MKDAESIAKMATLGYMFFQKSWETEVKSAV